MLVLLVLKIQLQEINEIDTYFFMSLFHYMKLNKDHDGINQSCIYPAFQALLDMNCYGIFLSFPLLLLRHFCLTSFQEFSVILVLRGCSKS